MLLNDILPARVRVHPYFGVGKSHEVLLLKLNIKALNPALVRSCQQLKGAVCTEHMCISLGLCHFSHCLQKLNCQVLCAPMFQQPLVLLCAIVLPDVVCCYTSCMPQGYAALLDTMLSTVMDWLVDHNVPIRTRVWDAAVAVASAGAGAPVNKLQLAILDLLREVTVPVAWLIGKPLGVAALALVPVCVQ